MRYEVLLSNGILYIGLWSIFKIFKILVMWPMTSLGSRDQILAKKISLKYLSLYFRKYHRRFFHYLPKIKQEATRRSTIYDLRMTDIVSEWETDIQQGRSWLIQIYYEHHWTYQWRKIQASLNTIKVNKMEAFMRLSTNNWRHNYLMYKICRIQV